MLKDSVILLIFIAFIASDCSCVGDNVLQYLYFTTSHVCILTSTLCSLLQITIEDAMVFFKHNILHVSCKYNSICQVNYFTIETTNGNITVCGCNDRPYHMTNNVSWNSRIRA